MRILHVLWMSLLTCMNLAYAKDLPTQLPNHKLTFERPVIVPAPPELKAKAYILVDAHSGRVLVEKEADKRLPPASLTKMMTMYIVSAAIREGKVKLGDKVRISETAWRSEGSRMFLKLGTEVPVEHLIRGVVIQSGNDACVALAEHLAGSEDAFSDLMNRQAALLGMTHSNFTDSTGMPHAHHYSTPRDLAILARALIRDFPEEYQWYKEKWFTYNGIRQPNRNRLLWRDPTVDGIKTGHTSAAGYCLASSAKRGNMRLIAVIMGAPSDAKRAAQSQRLLTYGFRFYETPKIYDAGKKVAKARVWYGTSKTIPVGVFHDFYVTVPRGTAQKIKLETHINPKLEAPIKKGQEIGEIIVKQGDLVVDKHPLRALTEDPRGNILMRLRDRVQLALYDWFHFGADSDVEDDEDAAKDAPKVSDKDKAKTAQKTKDTK